MKIYDSPGDIQKLVAPGGGVVSGGVYKIGQIVCVAGADAAAADEFEGKIRGIFVLAKASGAWTQGALLYWDNSAHNFTTTSGGNRLVGHATKAAGASDTTGYVYLDGTSRVDS